LELLNRRTISSRVCKLKVPILALIFLLALSSRHGITQQTDEDERLRELFLKSRHQMEIVSSPTTALKRIPNPAPSPLDQVSGSSTQETTAREFIQPNPTAKAPATPAEKVASAPTALPRSGTGQNQTESTFPTEKETASPTPKKKRHWVFFSKRVDDGSIVVQKSRAQAEKDLVPASGGGGGHWQYLTPAVRKAIDDARVARNRWKYIVVHNSGTRQGNSRIFDHYHRHVRKLPNGLAYHFVIGNGTSSRDGQVEIGNRWVRQINGGHVHSDYLNYISIGVCLVGDFNRALPTKAEYEALEELIRYLRQRVGKVDAKYSIVRGHKEINPRPTDCPGNRFPLNRLHRSFPD
jgi:N-acetylmuramoyl-L-alanine amidase